MLDLLARLEGDLCLSLEAGLAFDAALAEPSGQPWLRLVTALAKYRTAHSAVRAAAEALELVGGNGYTEDWATARLYRDAMVLPVWEGPGNIQALEVLRLLAGTPAGRSALLARWFLVRLSPAGLADPALDTALGPTFAAIVAGVVRFP